MCACLKGGQYYREKYFQSTCTCAITAWFNFTASHLQCYGFKSHLYSMFVEYASSPCVMCFFWTFLFHCASQGHAVKLTGICALWCPSIQSRVRRRRPPLCCLLQNASFSVTLIRTGSKMGGYFPLQDQQGQRWHITEKKLKYLFQHTWN